MLKGKATYMILLIKKVQIRMKKHVGCLASDENYIPQRCTVIFESNLSPNGADTGNVTNLSAIAEDDHKINLSLIHI